MIGLRKDSSSLLFFTLVTGLRRSLSLNLSDTRVYGHQIRARLVTAAHLCEVGVDDFLNLGVNRCIFVFLPVESLCFRVSSG